MAEIMEKDLVTRVRQRSDMVDNFFVSDIEVQTYINAGIAELHDLLIQTYGQDYYVSSATFTTVAGTSSYPIADSQIFTNSEVWMLS
jgi:citrate lyase synthetase